MTKRFLVTTALESTWPEDRSIIFLGEWCKLFDRKELWESFDSITVDYVYNNRDLLLEDYKYSITLYEKLLPLISGELNKVHKVNYNINFWRILIGPWLIFFIQILRERWQQIYCLQDMGLELETFVSLENGSEVPLDNHEFSTFFISDRWNYFIYSFIISNYTKMTFSKININECIKSESKRKGWLLVYGFSFRYLSCLNRARCKLFGIIPFNYRLIKTYLLHGIFDLKFPRYYFPKKDKKNRSEIILDFKPSNDFEHCLLNIIPLQIPRIYLEYFRGALDYSESFNYGKNFNSIATTDVYYNDLFKFWIANNICKNVKLFCLQHGGGYGIMKWGTNEYHEISISDQFLTWGWDDINSSKVRSFYCLKENPFNQNSERDSENILLILNALPRYSYKLSSEPCASQFLTYIKDQLSFLDLLPMEIYSKLVVRLYTNDYDWNIAGRLKEKNPNINIPSTDTPLSKLIQKSKLIIATTNSTSYIESLEANFPTIIFWDPEFWELRNDAISVFHLLKKVGIFHTEAKSAALHLTKIHLDVMQWWLSVEVQNARTLFVDKFCKGKVGAYNLIPNCLNGMQ
jgi:putative transferase (TIGR04331 family)